MATNKKVRKTKTQKKKTVETKTVFANKSTFSRIKIQFKDVPVPELVDEHGVIPVVRLKRFGPLEADEYEKFLMDAMGVHIDAKSFISDASKDEDPEDIDMSKVLKFQENNTHQLPMGKMHRVTVALSVVDENMERIFETPEEVAEIIPDNSVIRRLAQEANELNKVESIKKTVGN